MDHALDAGRRGGVEHRRRAADVDAHEVVHLAPLVDEGGGVDDEARARRSARSSAARSVTSADRRLDPGRGEPRRGGRGETSIADHLGALGGEPARGRRRR